MWIAAGCALLSLGGCLPLYMHYKALRPALGICFKALGTFCAVIPALIAALKLTPLCWLCAAALCLHVAADVVLEFQFIWGMGCFMLGHICYIAFFLKRFPPSLAHLVCAVALGLGLFFLLTKQKEGIGKNMLPFASYGVMLCLLGACAIGGGGHAGNLQGVMIALGAALFLFSDGLLFRNLLYPGGKEMDWAIMGTYYAGQLLLGASCLLC